MSDGEFAVCGDLVGEDYETEYEPGIAVIEKTGRIKHFWYAKYSVNERCMGLAYNPETARLAVMI